jgi:hypothetical protein
LDFCTSLEYALCDDGCGRRIGLGPIEVEKEAVKKALILAIQLALNALWSYLFFGLQNPMLAGLEIIVLVDDFETYIQFAKKNCRVFVYSVFGVGEFCCGVEWKYLVVE